MNEPYFIKKYFTLTAMCKINCFLVVIMLSLLTTLTISPVNCAMSLRNADDQPSTFTGQKALSDSIRFKREEVQAEVKHLRNSEVDKNVNKASEHDKDNNEIENPLNCSLPSNANNSKCIENKDIGYDTKSLFSQMKDNKDMLLRTLYVTLGVTGIVVVYFIIRAVRLRRKRTKSRKYGIITQQGDRGDMEMEPLGDGDDDEEDYTVFEVNGRKK